METDDQAQRKISLRSQKESNVVESDLKKGMSSNIFESFSLV